MFDYKMTLGILGTAIGFVGFIPYIRDIFLGKTKPHAFSWFVWSLLETIAFFAQFSSGGGAGTWITGSSALIALFIACIALSNKELEIHFFDWIALAGAVIGIILLKTTHDPFLAVVSVVASDMFGFIPTFRKAYSKPQEETLIEFSMSAVKWTIGLFALSAFTPTTALYPISLIFTNSLFVTMVLLRRQKKQK